MAGKKLRRDNVGSRAWWRSYVRIIDNNTNELITNEAPPTYTDGSATEDLQKDNYHIGWDGPATLFPAWRNSGAKPEHVLFYHIRPEAWDAKQGWSRWTNNCENAKCVNPFHAEFTAKSGDQMSFSKAQAVINANGDHAFDNQSVRNSEGTIRECVLYAYVGIMTDQSLHTLLSVDGDGNLVINNGEITNVNQDIVQMWGLHDNRTIVALNAVLAKEPTLERVYKAQERMIEDRKIKRHTINNKVARITNE
jgi:hypothetical protein